jgi:hypothetical protein
MNPTRPRTLPLLALAALASLPAACGTVRKRPLEERMAEFMRPYEELKRQKADLWRAGYQAQEFEFEGQGKVTVRRWELVGWPGDVYVKARLTYENTTAEPRQFALVWLDVLDADNRIVGTTAVRLVNPMGYAFWPGHTYTTEIQARTNEVHLDERGWSWTIACEAPIEGEPGVPPVLINHDLEDARAEQAWGQNQRLWGDSWATGTTLRGPLRWRYGTVDAGPHVPGVTRY